MESGLVDFWTQLPVGEVHVASGIPDKVAVFRNPPPNPEDLAHDIEKATGVHVRLGAWQPGEESGELQASLTVSPDDLHEVMRRLAVASAELFVERYHKPIDGEDTDWDDEAFAQDIGLALERCGMRWSDVDEGRLRESYRRIMHEASMRLATQ